MKCQHMHTTERLMTSVLQKCKQQKDSRERRGHDRMVVGFTINYAVSVYHHKRSEFESRSCEVYWIQHYVTDFLKVCGFLRFLPPIKLTATI